MKDSQQILLTYINCAYRDTMYYQLAVRLLQCKSHIHTYSIERMASECYVSCATLSRFCRKLGFHNYNDFKDGFQKSFIFHHYSNQIFNEAKVAPLEMAKHHSEDISNTLQNYAKNVDFKGLDALLYAIHETKNVLLLGHQMLQFFGVYFQQNLLRLDKLTYAFFQDGDQLSYVFDLEPAALVIILSVDGNYYSRHQEVIDELIRKNIRIALITQNEDSILLQYTTYPIILLGDNQNEVGKYEILFLIDLMMHRYKALFELGT